MFETPKDELQLILEKQHIETEWWEDYPFMKSDQDIENIIEAGKAQVIPNQGIGYKISAKVKPEFRVLENNTYDVLKKVSEAWLGKVKHLEKGGENVFLVVSSLARTEDFQQELIKLGYPAAENSTHTKLGAFDIAVKWFQENAPELKDALTEVLEDFVKEGTINMIDEPTIGVYHVASNPQSPVIL